MSAETDPSLSDLASQCHAALLEVVSVSMAAPSILSMLHTKIAVHHTWLEDTLQGKALGSSLCVMLNSTAALCIKRTDLVRGSSTWHTVARQVTKMGTGVGENASVYTLQSLLQRQVCDPSGEIAAACATQSAGEGEDYSHILHVEASQQQGADNQYLLILSQAC